MGTYYVVFDKPFERAPIITGVRGVGMSEFQCKQGHLMLPSEKKCRQCGGPVYYMDGMSDEQEEIRENKRKFEKQIVEKCIEIYDKHHKGKAQLCIGDGDCICLDCCRQEIIQEFLLDK